MENFTPVSALIGGGLIGLSALVYYLGIGRIAGISGIVGGLMTDGTGRPIRAAFVVGLLLGAAALFYGYGMPPAVEMQVADWPWLVVAGLLVGFGTRLGSGCTSGHGVCGLSRGSLRSLVATCTFFAVALVTVFVIRHVL
ncbi:YeeE/YedE family protein [Rhodospirillaceae bacterium KN72]|uniref:YeeE/YedE family protein n=1 Tax=Pacificispira spongiicola TaxID=2729598 RepID=A0A7Y0HGJ5_9PROT|nr:YeeE/YedE family protein [Pacificispira spongiicola]NMM44424.1 YeeE/YedE family protein [Pacificispira spongiicola]